MAKITIPDKSTGNTFSAAEFNEVKASVNAGYDEFCNSIAVVTEYSNLIKLDSYLRDYGLKLVDSDITVGFDSTNAKDGCSCQIQFKGNGTNLLNLSNFTNLDTSEVFDNTLDTINDIVFTRLMRANYYRIVRKITKLANPVVTGVSVDETTLQFDWANITGNNGYTYQVSLNGTDWGVNVELPINTIFVQITGLTVGDTRYVRVLAKSTNVELNSPWSNTATATTESGSEILTWQFNDFTAQNDGLNCTIDNSGLLKGAISTQNITTGTEYIFEMLSNANAIVANSGFGLTATTSYNGTTGTHTQTKVMLLFGATGESFLFLDGTYMYTGAGTFIVTDKIKITRPSESTIKIWRSIDNGVNWIEMYSNANQTGITLYLTHLLVNNGNHTYNNIKQ